MDASVSITRYGFYHGFIFDATGARMRTAPYTPARVQAALARLQSHAPSGEAAILGLVDSAFHRARSPAPLTGARFVQQEPHRPSPGPAHDAVEVLLAAKALGLQRKRPNPQRIQDLTTLSALPL
jgi:hypothetical protein